MIAQTDLFTDLRPRPASTVQSAPFQRTSRTSREQARRVRPNCPTQRERVLAYLKACPSGASMHRVAAALGIPLSGVCARCSELRELGLATDTDRDEPTQFGGKAALWVAT